MSVGDYGKGLNEYLWSGVGYLVLFITVRDTLWINVGDCGKGLSKYLRDRRVWSLV